MKQNKFERLLQHLLHPKLRVQRYFPTDELQRISRGIGQSEQFHSGQIRFVVESSMPATAIFSGITPRQRAWQWFAELGVWDTEHNSGVLIYISFADHAVEIAADRGIAAKVPQTEWQRICGIIEEAFRRQAYISGLEHGLQETDLLLRHHARDGVSDGPNELPDDVVLR